MKCCRLSFLSILLGATAMLASAATSPYDYDDDDDIYYDASKAKKQAQQATQAAQGSYYVPNAVVDYQDPALYTPATGGLDIDVDTYNRHGQFLVAADTVAAADSLALQQYQQPYVYVDQATAAPEINIYVNDGWGSPYYGYGYYGYPYYNYGWLGYPYGAWGPSWSFAWGWYDPWYSWSWGPGWGWNPGWGATWHPGHGPGHYPGFNRPGNGWAMNPAGASRPHSPAIGASTSLGRRQVSGQFGTSTGITRPGNMGQGRTVGTRQPSVTPTQTTTTGRASYINNTNTNTQTSRPSYNNSNSNNSNRSSWGSRPGNSGGGSRSVGGGSRGSGGGGGSTRGRR